VGVNPRCENILTFLRQHDLDQVPGVETKFKSPLSRCSSAPPVHQCMLHQ